MDYREHRWRSNVSLSEKLREIADDIEDTEIDSVDEAHVSFRVDKDVCEDTDVQIDQIDDPYEGTVLATIFTE